MSSLWHAFTVQILMSGYITHKYKVLSLSKRKVGLYYTYCVIWISSCLCDILISLSPLRDPVWLKLVLLVIRSLNTASQTSKSFCSLAACKACQFCYDVSPLSFRGKDLSFRSVLVFKTTTSRDKSWLLEWANCCLHGTIERQLCFVLFFLIWCQKCYHWWLLLWMTVS